MRTKKECMQMIMQGRDDELTKDEMRIVQDELDSMCNMIKDTDALIAELRAEVQEKGL